MDRGRLSIWRSFDTVIAQLGQAGVSFMTTLTFVHVLDAGDFGLLAAFWSIWMLLMAMNRAVFGEQLIAQSQDPNVRLGYLDFGYIWASVAILVSLVTAFLSDQQALIPGMLAVAFFVVSDMIRYSEMAEERKPGTRRLVLLPLEFVRIVASSVALVMALANFSPWWPISLALLSSMVWIIFGLHSNGFPKLGRAIAFVRRKEKFEALMTVQFLTGSGLQQVIPFLALHAFGAAQFGAMRLAQSVLSPMTVLTSAFQPALIRVYANSRQRGNFSKVVSGTVLLSMCIGAFMTWLAVWGVGVAGYLIIPSDQARDVSQILTPTAVILSLVVVGQPGGALIKVFRLGGVSLLGQAAGIAVTMVLCVLATRQDLPAFVWALAIGSASTVVSTYVFLVIGLARARLSRVTDCNPI